MELEKTAIMLADDNKDFVNILNEYLSSIDGFFIVGIANDGIDALNMIKEKKPDVVILDIVMPKLDGLGVLQRANRKLKKPQFIVLSAIGQDKTVQMALSLGADFFIEKPFDMEDLVLRIKQLQSLSRISNIKNLELTSGTENNTEQQVEEILEMLGMPEHLKGYCYIKSAIKLVMEDLSAMNSIYKKVYANIADSFGTTPNRVERAIRNAIEITWNKGNFSAINAMFPFEDMNGFRPANSEFILKLVDQINKL
ncbi:MAG TPA: sporulation transcription factor Spo0A [Oscillospiraceae bacterium]|nr:sporulation transcription factor Spo0A [Oscillospiraceae bacterium]